MCLSLLKLYSLKPTHCKKDNFENKDVEMCACHILVLLAQTFAVELSTSHPQIIDYNNCVGNHIHFLALFALAVPFIVQIRHKNMLMALIQSVKVCLFFSLAGTILNLVPIRVVSYLLSLL